MFIIGIDPRKASHTATVIDGNEVVIAELRLDANREQRRTLVDWAARFAPRTWAIEGATGVGALLAQQLAAVGEVVLDVPATLSARARLLDSGRKDKTDAHDARSAAIVALRHPNLSQVIVEDHAAILRMLARRHHQLIAGRTRSVCRLHGLLALLIEGGRGRRLSAEQGAIALASLQPATTVEHERVRIAHELLDEVRAHDQALRELHRHIGHAVVASDTTVTDIDGVGPIVAAYLVGHSGDPRRFPTAGHYARYNATAPIEASSGPRVRHRLNPNGNRQLNHALHIAALGQISHDTIGRVYYRRKLDQGKNTKEALRCLKRQISDAVYAHLRADIDR